MSLRFLIFKVKHKILNFYIFHRKEFFILGRYKIHFFQRKNGSRIQAIACNYLFIRNYSFSFCNYVQHFFFSFQIKIFPNLAKIIMLKKKLLINLFNGCFFLWTCSLQQLSQVFLTKFQSVYKFYLGSYICKINFGKITSTNTNILCFPNRKQNAIYRKIDFKSKKVMR